VKWSIKTVATQYLLLDSDPLICATKPAVEDSKVSTETHWHGSVVYFSLLLPFLFLKGTSVEFNLFGNPPINAMNLIFGNDRWFNFRCQRHNSLCSLSSFYIWCISSILDARLSKLKGDIGSMSSSAWHLHVVLGGLSRCCLRLLWHVLSVSWTQFFLILSGTFLDYIHLLIYSVLLLYC